jgi:hypothetical protein
VSYRVIVNGDGENYWTGHDDFVTALARFVEEMQPERKVTLEWEHFDYEPE